MLTDFLSVLSTNFIYFSVLWIVVYSFARVSLIDVLWASSIGLWGLSNLREAYLYDPGSATFALSAVTVIWSMRLSLHLYHRLSRTDGEDPRYASAKKENPDTWGRRSYGIFVLNAVLASLMILPQRLLILDLSESKISLLQIVGVIMSALSIAGEATADGQLKKFVAMHSGKTCQTGLWKYSRHPNYFFEWLFWVGAFLCALPSEDGIWAIVAPIVIFIFVRFFTGVTLSEKDAEKKRPDFAAYKKRTNAFFPWFPG